MAILKNKTQSNFTMINNIVFRDQDLKLIDRGLLSTIISLPDGWDFNVKGLAQIVPDGKDAIKASLKRLKEKGYLRSYQSRDKNGTLGSNIIEVFPDIDAETPENTAFQPWTENPLTDNPLTVNPLTDNPLTDNPRADNPQQYNTITIKNERIKDCINVVVNQDKNEINKGSDNFKKTDRTTTDIETAIKKQISYDELLKSFPEKEEALRLIVDIIANDTGQSDPADLKDLIFKKVDKAKLTKLLNKLPPLNELNNPENYIRQSLYNLSEENKTKRSATKKTGFHNFTERNYDFEELERIGLNAKNG